MSYTDRVFKITYTHFGESSPTDQVLAAINVPARREVQIQNAKCYNLPEQPTDIFLKVGVDDNGDQNPLLCHFDLSNGEAQPEPRQGSTDNSRAASFPIKFKNPLDVDQLLYVSFSGDSQDLKFFVEVTVSGLNYT